MTYILKNVLVMAPVYFIYSKYCVIRVLIENKVGTRVLILFVFSYDTRVLSEKSKLYVNIVFAYVTLVFLCVELGVK